MGHLQPGNHASPVDGGGRNAGNANAPGAGTVVYRYVAVEAGLFVGGHVRDGAHRDGASVPLDADPPNVNGGLAAIALAGANLAGNERGALIRNGPCKEA